MIAPPLPWQDPPHPGVTGGQTSLQGCIIPSQPSLCKLTKSLIRENKADSSKTRENKYICKICKKSLSRKYRLIQHLKLHSDIKPHKCSQCSFRSSSAEGLCYHTKSVHTNFRPHKCPSCSYSSLSKKYLKKHLRVHTGEKPFKCLTCNFAAKRKGSIIRHMLIHTGEKPFKCPTCEFATAHKGTLVGHMRTHTHTHTHTFSAD